MGGDNDPIDVVELSDPNDFKLERGHIVPIKVLGVLGLIDEGETDWKIIGLRANHPLIGQIHSVEDADRLLGKKMSEVVVDWFENHKMCLVTIKSFEDRMWRYISLKSAIDSG